MPFEILLLMLALGTGIFMIGIPSYKLVKSLFPTKRNTLAEAKERLQQARVESEAALLNKETERLYENLYKDVLEDEPSEKENRKV